MLANLHTSLPSDSPLADRYSEYGAAVLILLMSAFALVAHWLACIWSTSLLADEQDLTMLMKK